MFLFRLGIALLTASVAAATTYDCATYSVPGSTGDFVSGINNSGVMVGYYEGAGMVHGFIGNINPANFQTVDYGGGTWTSLSSVNNRGVATVGSYFAQFLLGVFMRDSTGTYTQVASPPPYQIFEFDGINDNGAIAVLIGDPRTGPITFGILNPDGTLTPVSGDTSASFAPGAINNSLQMLESESHYGQTNLVDASGSLAPVSAGGLTFAFGLNNLGVIAGYFTPGTQLPKQPPFIGFTRDASGVYSHVFCPGIPLNSSDAPLWQAINDNGVLAGNPYPGSGALSPKPYFYVATPVPGQAQVSLSSSGLVFPPTPVGQTSPPQTVTLTNTGDARLDIGGFVVPAAFQVTGCLDPTTQTASLNPGASCTLSVTATPASQGVTSGSTGIEDSASGSPQEIAVSVTGTAPPPPCQISSVTATGANFTMQDTNSGLSSIIVADSSNTNVTISPFVSGTTSPVNVTASQIDSSRFSTVGLRATNVAGGATSCEATFGGPTGWTGIGGSLTGKTVTVTNTDGWLQNFSRGTDNALWTTAQSSSDEGWTGWQSLGGVITSDPSVVVNIDGRVEAFAIGTDGALWHIWQTSAGGPWSGWESLGGGIVSDPAAIANPDGQLEVFVVGTDHSLWHIRQNSAGGSWSGWAPLEGDFVSNPAVVVNTDGRLEVFAVAPDQTLWHRVQIAPSSDWSGWASLGGSVAGDPVLAINQDSRLEVFARGGDNQLWHAWQTSEGGSWAPFSALGGVLTSDPGIGIDTDGRLEAFVRGTDNGLWHITQTAVNSGWGDWASLGGVLANGPTAVRNQDGRLEVFVEGADTTLWYIEQAATGFWN